MSPVPLALLDPQGDDAAIDGFLAALGVAPVARSEVPWWERLTIVRHLAGQHDQSTHGHGGGKWTAGGLGTAADPIRTDDVVVAQQALAAGQYVQLRSEREVSTLVDQLATDIHGWERAGKPPPAYDLCKVSVPKTNLFCSASKGIPRAQMPQLKGRPVPGSPADLLPKDAKGEVDLSAAFTAHLTGKGMGVTETTIDAKFLKASQNQLDGVKVVGMADAIRAGKVKPAPIFVTRDDYIVDGHHRWAANVAVSYTSSTPVSMPVHKVDADIITVLSEAKKFAADQGLPQVGFGSRAVDCVDCLPEVVIRHLAGQHDQSTHGHGGGAAGRLTAAGFANADLSGLDGPTTEAVVSEGERLAADYPEVFRAWRIGIAVTTTEPTNFAQTSGSAYTREAQIKLNRNLWTNPSQLSADLAEYHQKGWLAGETPAYVIDHEFGHVADRWLGASETFRFVPDVPPSLSAVARPKEFFAETFAQLRGGVDFSKLGGGAAQIQKLVETEL